MHTPRCLLAFIIFFSSRLMVAAQPATAMTMAERIEALSTMWSSARQNFANFDLSSVNWDSAYKATIPAVLEAKDDVGVYKVMAKMLALLKDGHTGVYHIPSYPKSRLPLTTALIENKVIITTISNDSLITHYGLNVGDEIIAVNKTPVFEYAAQFISPYQFASTPQDLAVKTYTHALLYDEPLRPVEITVLKNNGKTISCSISRQMSILNSPPAFSLKMLPGNIALLTLHSFQEREYKKVFDSLYKMILPARALIIDVRRHSGGDGAQGNYILSHFIDKPVAGARSKTRQHIAAFTAWGRQPMWMEFEPSVLKPMEGKELFLKPMLLLTGAQTYSAAEDLCLAFDVSRRGIKIGQPTAGSTGQPLRVDLPGNGILMICSKRDSYPDGQEFIGIGIQPEIFVPETISAFTGGKDAVLEKAIKYIVNKN